MLSQQSNNAQKENGPRQQLFSRYKERTVFAAKLLDKHNVKVKFFRSCSAIIKFFNRSNWVMSNSKVTSSCSTTARTPHTSTGFRWRGTWGPGVVGGPTQSLGRFSRFCSDFQEFCEGFQRFCPDFLGFCPNFYQIKTFGGALAPHLLHQRSTVTGRCDATWCLTRISDLWNCCQTSR